MKLTEILQNSDVAHILAVFLQKRLQGNWVVDAKEGEKVIWVATMADGSELDFRIECQRMGKTFDVDTTYRAVSSNDRFKTMQDVLDHILEVRNDHVAWELDNLPHSDA